MVRNFFAQQGYLKKIQSEQANITWRLRGGQAGLFKTQLLITPNGRDFDYFATGGRLKMAPVPDLDLRRTHLLITKTLLTLYDLDVASDSSTDESIKAQGHAGLGEDKRIDVKANFDSVRIRQWLPAEWKGVSMAALSVIFITPERIQNWKTRLAKVPCVSKTGELMIFRF